MALLDCVYLLSVMSFSDNKSSIRFLTWMTKNGRTNKIVTAKYPSQRFSLNYFMYLILPEVGNWKWVQNLLMLISFSHYYSIFELFGMFLTTSLFEVHAVSCQT